MEKLDKIPRVSSVEVRPPYGLHVTFDDGLIRMVDLAEELWGPMFEPLKEPSFFAQVTVEHGTAVWPNGLDLDPLVLYGDFDAATVRPKSRVG
jgi:hypothetical protein